MAYAYGSAEWEQAYREMLEKRLAAVSAPYIMGTLEWTDTFEKKIQDSEAYKESAKKWEGTVVIHMLANPEMGLDDDLFIMMDLWHGDCRSVRLVPREVGEKADYVLTGELERWEAINAGELDVTKAMMQGKIKLKGDLPTIVRYVKASNMLTEISSSIDAIFLSRLSDAEREQNRKEFNELRAVLGI